MLQENVKGPLLISYGYANDAMVASRDTDKPRKFARLGWNGKKLYVTAHKRLKTNCVFFTEENIEDPRAYIEPFFVIVNEDAKTVNTWVASVSDAQGKDWYEVF